MILWFASLWSILFAISLDALYQGEPMVCKSILSNHNGTARADYDDCVH